MKKTKQNNGRQIIGQTTVQIVLAIHVKTHICEKICADKINDNIIIINLTANSKLSGSSGI